MVDKWLKFVAGRENKSAIIDDLEVALTNEKAKVASAIRKIEDAEKRAELAVSEARAAKHYLEEIRVAVDALYHVVYPQVKAPGESPR